MKIRKGSSSKDIVYTSGSIVDTDFKTYNKNEILNRVQYWKDYFSERSITKISIHFYQCLDCVAIVLACMENGITIYTGAYSSDGIDKLSNDVDLTIVGFGKTEIPLYRPKFLNANHYHTDPKYVPTEFKLDSILIRNVGDPNRVFSNWVEYTVEEFILANKPLLSKVVFNFNKTASIQYTMHYETLPIILAPLMYEQSTVYSCSHMIEMASLLRTQRLNTIIMSPTHLQAFKLIEDSINSQSPFGEESFKFEFSGVEVITTRTGPQKAALSADVCDWLFSRGVRTITAFYTPDTSLMPCFSKQIAKKDKEYFSNDLGNSLVDYKIIDKKLYINDVDTGDYAEEYNGQVFFKGNQLVNHQYIADVQRFMLGIINDPDVTLSDFIIEYDVDTLTVYSFRTVTHDKISTCKTLKIELLNFAGIQNIEYKHWDKSKVYSI